MLARLNLRTKVTLLLLALSVGPLLISGIANENRAVKSGKAAVLRRHAQAARFAADTFTDLFLRLHRHLDRLARTLPNPIDARLLRDLNRAYAAVFIIPPGEPAVTDPAHWTLSALQRRPDWERLQSEGGVVVSGGSVVAIAPRQISGAAVIIVLETDYLQALIRRAAFNTGEGGSHSDEVALISPGRRLAAHSESDHVGYDAPPLFTNLQPGSIEVEQPDGETVLLSVDPVDPSGWYVVLATQTRQAYRSVYSLVWLLSGVVILTFLFVLLLADNLATVIIRPIHQLEEGARMIGSGALDYRIDLSEHAHDELGHLARAFNQMGENLLEGRQRLDAYSRNLEEAHRELDAMVYAITHDLKKSLRGIEAFSTFLEEDYGATLDDDGRELLAAIHDNVLRINRLADDLIGLVERERIEGHAEPVATGELLREVRQSCLHRFPGEVIITPGMPEVMANRERLLLVFSNLVSNGLKFNTSDQPLVTVRCKEQGPNWCFEVQDNGIGIEHRYQERIFELFSRLNHKEDYEGTGTGLNLIRRILQEHRGGIEVHSAPGLGSTFVVTLPKEPEALAEPSLTLQPFSVRMRSGDGDRGR